jgi:uncharacterized damage-inducible protein DinB
VGDATIEAARDLLGDSLDELRQAVDGCSPEQLNRRPAGEETNSLTVLATHALHSTRSWISLATGADLPHRDRPAEFRVVVEDVGAFISWFDATAGECRALLDAADPFDPGRVGTAPWRADDRAAEPVTAAWALLHALSHLREHVGHAQLTRQALLPGA